MSQTPLGITYPEAGSHTRLWEHFQTMAQDTDRLLQYNVETPGATVNNWEGTGTSVRGQRVGGLVALTIVVTREGFDLNPNQGYSIYALDPEWRPLFTVYGVFVLNTTYAPEGRLSIAPDGDVRIRSKTSAAIGSQVQASIVYAAPTS